MARFLDDADVVGEDRAFFTRMIYALDQEYIAFVSEQIKQAINEATHKAN